MSDDLAGVLFRHRERLKEIGNVLSRYGFARRPTGSAWPSSTSATSAALPERARPRSRTCCSPSALETSTS